MSAPKTKVRKRLPVETGDGRQRVPGLFCTWVARAHVHGGRYLYLVQERAWNGSIHPPCVVCSHRGDAFAMEVADGVVAIVDAAMGLEKFRCGRHQITEAVKNLLAVAELLGLQEER